jgi:hypothetical protein
MLNQGTPCNPSQRHKALQSSQIDTPEARKEKHVKKMRNRSMTCSYKVYSLVQDGGPLELQFSPYERQNFH